MENFDLLRELKNYKPFNEKEQSNVDHIIDFLEHGENQFIRTNLIQHIVASAYLLNFDLTKILLTHHKALGVWLPFGGHSDGEQNSLNVALRETMEESGILNPILLSDKILDVDIHTIPENKAKNEPEHKHLDIRFCFKTNQTDFVVSDESDSLKWFDLEDFFEMIENSSYFSGTDRIEAKLKKIILDGHEVKL